MKQVLRISEQIIVETKEMKKMYGKKMWDKQTRQQTNNTNNI